METFLVERIDKQGKIHWLHYEKLGECKVGDSVRFAAVIHSADDFLRFLNTRELHLGMKIKIKSAEQFDGSMVISYNKRTASQLVKLLQRDCCNKEGE